MEHINSTKGDKKLLKFLKYPQNLAISEEKQSYTTSQLIFLLHLLLFFSASNMRNLDTSLTRKDEALNECLNEKNNHGNKIKSLQSELSEKEVNMENLQTLNVSTLLCIFH